METIEQMKASSKLGDSEMVKLLAAQKAGAEASRMAAVKGISEIGSLVDNSANSVAAQDRTIEQIFNEVSHILDKPNGVFGPSYDVLNAKLLSKKTAISEVLDKELAEFQVEKEEMRHKLFYELAEVRLQPAKEQFDDLKKLASMYS
jgi:hypothetical protein